MSDQSDLNQRPDYDEVLKKIADYVLETPIDSQEALDTARLCMMDALGCGLLALRFPECTKHLGPIVPGTVVPNGARVPGTSYVLDPVQAAWDIGCAIRWLDYNDCWLAAEWGHPSDNLAAVLAVADYESRKAVAQGDAPYKVKDLLIGMVKAHEIQGVMALENCFNRVGLDHVALVKLASTAVSAKLMGANREQVLAALSQVFVDGQALRTYRHAPNTGSRKSWAAGDASARGVRLADIAMRGEMGIPSVLTAPQWGFYDVSFSHYNRDLSLKPENEQVFQLPQPFGSYVMENVLFKVSFPAEFHAQTACEAGITLHPLVKDRLKDITRIRIRTQESAIRIISKRGPLANAADRDHSLQYMTAVALAFGDVRAEFYEDDFAKQPIIDELRELMEVVEDPRFTREYLEADKRSIANAVQVFFKDGTSTDDIEVNYPIGHRRRRADAIPLIEAKFRNNLATRFPAGRCDEIVAAFKDAKTLDEMPVNKFVELFTD